MNETVCIHLLPVNGHDIRLQINWEESSNAARVCVRPHVDAELDEWKRMFHGLDSVLVKSLSSDGDRC